MKHAITVFVLSILLLVGCDDYEDETYNITAIDRTACGVFEVDTLLNTVTAKVIPDTIQTLSEQITFLDTSGSIFTVNNDSLWKFTVPADTVYTIFKSTASIPTIFYYNKKLKMIVTDGSGNNIEPDTDVLSLEMIAECEYIVSRDPHEFGRLEFSFGNASYLVRFTMEERASFKMVVLNEE